MIYILLGEDHLAKEQKIAEIKKKWFQSVEAIHFDYDVLYASKLDPAEFKKSLVALPVIAPARFIIVRSAQNLSSHHQEILLEQAKIKDASAIVILDSDQDELKADFINKIKPFAKVISFAHGAAQNVFDMTNSIARRNPTEALKILGTLLEEGIHPLQIMGGLVWFWGKSRERLPKENFKRGLQALKEGDLNIKRSRIEPQYALEVLVTKLCHLIA